MKRVVFDYSKLSGKIKEKFGSQKAFSKVLGVTEATLSRKMHSVYYFGQDEIMGISDMLGIGQEKISEYFFAQKVQ